MGKLEKIGRSLWKRIGGKSRRSRDTVAEVTSSSSSSSSSDEEDNREYVLKRQEAKGEVVGSMPESSRLYVLSYLTAQESGSELGASSGPSGASSPQKKSEIELLSRSVDNLELDYNIGRKPTLKPKTKSILTLTPTSTPILDLDDRPEHLRRKWIDSTIDTNTSVNTKRTPDDAEILRDKSQSQNHEKRRIERVESRQSDEISAGYATDDTVLSSLGPLDVNNRSSVDYFEGSESLGYHSTAELSPRDASDFLVPRINVSSKNLGRTPGDLYLSHQNLTKVRFSPMVQRSQYNLDRLEVKPKPDYQRAATVSDLDKIEDPIDSFLKNNIYKTKLVTTVFEAKNGGFEEIYDDVVDEIDRWFETKNMMAVACELHFSVPEQKRSRQLESRLKDKLLAALRDNNKRLLYLKGMGKGKMPIKLAESKTIENISKDKETSSIRGIYQRSYTRLLPYLHKETPEWHSQYWSLHDHEPQPQPAPQQFLFGDPPQSLKCTTLISLNIIGLSILGNKRQSCNLIF